MRKYWAIAKTYTKTQLVWRADVIFNMIFTISRILFAYLLWGILFQGKETVGMFTFHGILSYYIVNSFLSQLEMSDGISGEIHYRIRNGTFFKVHGDTCRNRTVFYGDGAGRGTVLSCV